MARNTPLAIVRAMVKAETGKSLESTSTSQDAEINQLINDTQARLASMYDWPFLKSRWDTTLATSSRYQAFPSTNNVGLVCQVDLERPVTCLTKWNNIWIPVVYGIDEIPEFNYLDSDRNQVLDPIQRWQFDDETQFEVWPMPASNQQVRFVGQREPTQLQQGQLISTSAGVSGVNGVWTAAISSNTQIGVYYTIGSYWVVWLGNITSGVSNVWAVLPVPGAINYASALYVAPTLTGTWSQGPAAGTLPVPSFSYSVGTSVSWDDSATLDLDDQLVCFFTAADYLVREENPKAQLEIAKAQRHLQALRGAYPVRAETCAIGRGLTMGRKAIRQVPLVLVGGK